MKTRMNGMNATCLQGDKGGQEEREEEGAIRKPEVKKLIHIGSPINLILVLYYMYVCYFRLGLLYHSVLGKFKPSCTSFTALRISAGTNAKTVCHFQPSEAQRIPALHCLFVDVCDYVFYVSPAVTPANVGSLVC